MTINYVQSIGSDTTLCNIHSGVYAIVTASKGTRYELQAGGYACNHPIIEGSVVICICDGHEGAVLFAKLQNYFVGPKHAGWCTSPPGIDRDDAAFIENFVPNFKVDLTRLSESEEACIYGFLGGTPAVLIWPNSD